MKTVLVMGPGCKKCDEAEKVFKEAAAEAGVETEVQKVSDFREMAQYGVFSTPAVVVDGEVKVVGRVPKKADVLEWLR